METKSFWPSSASWVRYWPNTIASIIAVIQLFLSLTIVALQTAIVVIGITSLEMGLFNSVAGPIDLDSATLTRYIMGYVCWVFFLACWITIFCVTCCNRSSVGCATYALVKNVLAFIFSAVLIDFERKNVAPSTDFNIDPILFNSLGVTSFQLSKAQLALAVLMLVSSFAYIVVYIYTYIRALLNDGKVYSMPGPVTVQSIVQPVRDYGPTPMPTHVAPPAYISNTYSKTVDCANCGTKVPISK